MTNEEFQKTVKQRVAARDELIHMSNPELADAVLLLNEQCQALRTILDVLKEETLKIAKRK